MFAYTKLMQAMVAAGVVTPTDPYFNLVTLLLPGNGTNGAQNNTFLDSSTNNFTITRNGNTTQGTFSPFSQTGWGNYFNGSTDYLLGGNSTAYTLGTGDFSIEFFFYATSSGTTVGAIGTGGADVGKTVQVFLTSTNQINFNAYTGSNLATGTNVWSTNQWTHVVITRSSGNARIFINGVLRAYGALTDNLIGADLSIGRSYYNLSQEYFPGYISNVRFIKGSIPTTYQTSSTTTGTSVFTSPTAALTTTSQGATGADVSILTCQSNRFVDNSTASVKTVTPYGSVSVQAFSPFAPTAAYSAADVGGSMYQDPSGDYLSLATNNSAFQLGASDWCVEGWMYKIASGVTYIASGQTDGTTIAGSSFYLGSDGGHAFSGGSRIDLSATLPRYAWTHLVFCRTGSTVSLFQNGVRVGTGTFSGTINTGSTTYPPKIGASGVDTGLEQYLSGFRIVKGSSPYDATLTTITVPTAPPTAVSGTAILCNFTNAGITDATAKNVLETVGNAQISTTQSKFGGSSMYFDGTGDWLVIPDSPNLRISNGDKFTIEGWIYLTTINTTQGIVVKRAGSATQEWGVLVSSGNKLQFGSNTTNYTANTSLSANTWYYFAVTCDGTNINIYLNGTSDFTPAAVSGIVNSTNAVVVGAQTTSANPFYGYIDDLRITKGYARTISASPTAAFPLN